MARILGKISTSIKENGFMIKRVSILVGDILEVRYGGYRTIYITSSGTICNTLEEAKEKEIYFNPKDMFPKAEPTR